MAPYLYNGTIPNLVSIHNESCSSLDSSTALSRESSTNSIESKCEDNHSSARRVSFCDWVDVQEFHRLPEEEGKNYISNDLQTFSLQSHRALAAAVDHDAGLPSVQNQIRRILLVDSHDLSLNLIAKAFQKAFPRAIISTATESKEALFLCEKATVAFDLVVVEERLSLFRRLWGSQLLKVLHQTMPHCLFIGVSAHIGRDQATLVEAGADLIWSKPLPPLDESTVEKIFQRLKLKRNLLS